MKWEIIDANHRRTKVPGGWIVEVFSKDVFFSDSGAIVEDESVTAICYVPDIAHRWNIKEGGE